MVGEETEATPAKNKVLITIDDEEYGKEETGRTELEEALSELVDDVLKQLKTFLIILYGAVVRFYSTVVDWDYIHSMREDLIERMTSKLFQNEEFHNMILGLCGELTRN